MDTPWLYLYATHKFHQFQRSAFFTTVELTVGKAFVLKGLTLELYCKDDNAEKEGRVEIRTSTTTYLRVSSYLLAVLVDSLSFCCNRRLERLPSSRCNNILNIKILGETL